MKNVSRLCNLLRISALVSIIGCTHNTTIRHDATIESKPVFAANTDSSEASWPVVPIEIWTNYNTVQLVIEATVIESGDTGRHGWAKVNIDKILINRSNRKIETIQPLIISYDSYEPVPPTGKCVLFLRLNGDTTDLRWFLDRAVNHINPWEIR